MATVDAAFLQPLSELLALEEFPSGLILPEDGSGSILDRIFILDHVTTQTPSGPMLTATAAVEGELAVGLPGCPTLSLVIGPGVPDFTVAQVSLLLAADWVLEISQLKLALRVDPAVLRPVDGAVPATEFVVETSLRVTADAIRLEERSGLTLPKSYVGDSGVTIEAQGLKLNLRNEPETASGDDPAFGLSIARAVVGLPADAAALAPDEIVLTDGLIGRDGFSGRTSIVWATPGSTGPVRSLLGFTVELQQLALQFEASRLVRGEIAAMLRQLPFFDTDVALDLSLGGGGLKLALSTVRERQTGAGATIDAAGLLVLRKPGIIEMSVTAAEIDTGPAGALRLSGTITPLVGFAGVKLPGFRVEALTITGQGRVSVEGGWIALPRAERIGFGGFGLDVTKVGLGSEIGAARWVGYSGALRLVEGVPLTTTLDGLKIRWDAGGLQGVELSGIGLRFEVESVLKLDGTIRYSPGADPGQGRFDGSGMLQLISLGLTVRAQITIGRQGDVAYLFLNLLLQPPIGIPLFATGLSIYGFQALYARNMAPDKQPAERWYQDWYLRPEIGADDGRKWAPARGGQAFGAGVMIGTSADKGYSVMVKGLLVVVVPGPVLLLDARANLLKDPMRLADPQAQALFNALVVFDGRQGTFEASVQPRYLYPDNGRLVDMTGIAEAFYSFHDPRAWHVYLGRREPEQRIRARLLSLFDADAYLMIDPDRLIQGGHIGYDLEQAVGPADLSLHAFMECEAELSRRPRQLRGELHLGATVGVSVCGVGIDLTAAATLAAQGPQPWAIDGSIEVKVGLPWPLPDIDASIHLHWEEPGPPRVAPVLEAVGFAHLDTGTSWQLAPGVDDGPVVPLDGRLGLVFDRAVRDHTGMGNDLGGTEDQVGDYRLRAELAGIELQVRDTAAPDQPWKPFAIPEGDPAGDPRRLTGAWQTQPGDSSQGNRRLMLDVRSIYEALRPLTAPNILQQHAQDGFDPCRPRLPVRVADFNRYPDALFAPWQTFSHADISWTPLSSDEFVQIQGRVADLDQFAPDQEPSLLPARDGFFDRPLSFPIRRCLGLLHATGTNPTSVLQIGFPGSVDGFFILAWSPANTLTADALDDDGRALAHAATIVPTGPRALCQLTLTAPAIRRVVVGSITPVQILAVGWRDTPSNIAVRRSVMEAMVESFRSDEPILEPNRQYRLLVRTRVVEASGASLEGAQVDGEGLPAGTVALAGNTCTFEQTFPFCTEGPPGAANLSEVQPGVRPSQLETLETYVRATVPPPGAPAFYRNYDLGIAFTVDVERMYRSNGQTLAIALRSDRGEAVTVANALGKGEIILRREERVWLEMLQRSSCELTVNPSSFVRETKLSAMPDQGPLEPRRRYDATLVGDPRGPNEGQRPLLQWSFVTSAFRNFAEHFRLGSRPSLAALVEIEGPAWTALAQPALAAGDPWESDGPERAQRRAIENDVFAAMTARASLEAALPRLVELQALEAKGVTWALLLASPEPFDWARLAWTLTAETREPFAPAWRAVRDGDCTRTLLLALQDGAPVPYPAGRYTLAATYRRDAGPGLPVLTERGVAGEETASIAWSIPVEPEPGFHPLGPISRLLLLKERKGPLQIHIDVTPWGLNGGDIHATDVLVLGPSGQDLWSASRFELMLAGLPYRTRPSGETAIRFDISILTDEIGVFQLVFRSFAFPLYQRLTDDLPEALLLSPGDESQLGSVRGMMLNPVPPGTAGGTVTMAAKSVKPPLLEGGPIRINDTVIDLNATASLTIEGEMPFEAVVGRYALGRFTVDGPLLFGSDAAELHAFLPYLPALLANPLR